MDYSSWMRFQDALSGKPRDYVPIFPIGAGWSVANFSDDPPSKVARNPELIIKVHTRAREEMGYDFLFTYVDPLYIPEAFGCNVRFLETGPVVDPLPLTLKVPESLEELPKPDPEKEGRLPVVLEAAEGMSGYSDGNFPVVGLFEGAFTTACRIIEAEQILRMVYRNREVLELYLDRVNSFLTAFGRALIKRGANTLLITEPTASASMISPLVFRQFVLPRLQKLMGSFSVPCILHICGDTSSLLELMAQSGAAALSLDQCMNLSETKGMISGTVLAGNVDPINSLWLGDRDRVVEDSLNCLKQGGTNRFILMSGCMVPPESPVENVKAMIRTAVEYGLG